MVHLTQTRELNIVHKKMIVDNSKVNKGPVMTYRMFKEYVRGYQNVGASLEDFKNFSRDIKKFLSEGDAQMLIENFMKIKRMCPSFYFDFEVDEKGKNKYRMIFTPFTGVDHHKRCVTFGAGLLINESKESFAWLFTRFLEDMGGRYPVCIITDEHLGIEGGLKKVFKDKVQHRYCMWHILKKFPEKVGPVICRETEFLKEINSCVWGEDVEPAEFEERWTAIVQAHGLSNNEWLQEKYGIRQFWIPAYLRDLLLGGLMRTTSRSESENHFFSNFTNPNLTLVEFWMRFESAMDTQRWPQSKLIAQSKYSFPDLATPLDLEKHAAETYTPRIFEEFKVEIKAACFTCAIGDKEKDKNHAILYIDVKDRERKKDYKVGYKTAEVKLVCNCKKFERHGILCRHILCVLKDYGFEKIPSEYLLNRWSKLATRHPNFNSMGGFCDCRSVDAQKNKPINCGRNVHLCVTS
ncbi:protein FAR-RED IMPAIRED RESPONSE 1-like [Silene latifolia]|uniref:protein FAR-RED IMPAIRED RESPONSE 1-like n=1 Tax=Silene latifolia TaxID=37657 RepID=UPI003D7824B5